MESRLSLQELNNVAEVEIVYRRKPNCKASEKPVIHTSSDAYAIFMHYWNLDTIELIEEFKVLYLNRRNTVLQLLDLSKGGISGTIADTRLILASALKVCASSVVLAHNHPSGIVKPSRADQALTHKIKIAASYHDILIVDHLIVSQDCYFSFGDEGLL